MTTWSSDCERTRRMELWAWTVLGCVGVCVAGVLTARGCEQRHKVEMEYARQGMTRVQNAWVRIQPVTEPEKE